MGTAISAYLRQQMSNDTTLAIFAMPKAFDGHIGVIQRNAIRSWSRLTGVQTILLGDESGTATMAEEVDATHIPKVECNEYGTPYVASCFAAASSASSASLLAYVNADIILMSDFVHAVERVAQRHRLFLLAGQRTDLDLVESLAFEDGWDLALRKRAEQEGHLLGPEGIDYFVFRPGLFTNIPPFAIGRWIWDNWLLREATRVGPALIDATPSIRVIHQSHDYNHVGDNKRPLKTGPEAIANLALSPDPKRWYDLHHATRILYPWRFAPAWTPQRIRKRTNEWRRDHPRLLAPLSSIRLAWLAIMGGSRKPGVAGGE